MSEKDRLEHKETIKKLEIKKVDKYDKLAGKIGVIIAGLLFLILLIVALLTR